MVPETFNHYYEPFLGSGALFFHLEPLEATLGDVLKPLVDTYLAVKEDPDEIHRHIGEWTVDRETYYEVRALIPKSQSEAAAQFIYLNKTAWNGLYRVNRQGNFNVPFGRPKSDNIVPLATLQEASSLLSSARITCTDFETTLGKAEAGDFVFIDPPYVTSHNNNGFVEYNEKLFSWDDQVRLAELCEDMASRGIEIVITNADHSAIRELYKDFYLTEFQRHSTLAGKSENRRVVSELIFSTRQSPNG